MKNAFAQITQFIFFYKYEALCICISIVSLIGAIGVLVYDLGPIGSSDPVTDILQANSSNLEGVDQELSGIWVDVSGAVQKAGIYELPSESRVADAITKAGGLDSHVDLAYFTKNINLAKALKDEEKVYIPYISEQVSESIDAPPLDVSTSMKININTASQSQLESLPGVGSVTAQKIMAARPIQDLQDLTVKKIISASVFEKMQDLIRL